jgi:hypothetical protein
MWSALLHALNAALSLKLVPHRACSIDQVRVFRIGQDQGILTVALKRRMNTLSSNFLVTVARWWCYTTYMVISQLTLNTHGRHEYHSCSCSSMCRPAACALGCLHPDGYNTHKMPSCITAEARRTLCIIQVCPCLSICNTLDCMTARHSDSDNMVYRTFSSHV